jgi:hypothetical protein
VFIGVVDVTDGVRPQIAAREMCAASPQRSPTTA